MYDITVTSRRTDYFPNNKPWSFGYHVPHPLNQLESRTFVISCNYIITGKQLRIFSEDQMIYRSDGQDHMEICKILSDRVLDLQSLYDFLESNEKLNHYLQYNSKQNTLTIKLSGNYFFSEELGRVLGFEKMISIAPTNSVQGLQQPSVPSWPKLLFVYCNIVHRSIVGDNLEPLLTIIPPGDGYFQLPYGLNPKVIVAEPLNSIHFWIKNEKGEDVYFNEDVTISLSLNKT